MCRCNRCPLLKVTFKPQREADCVWEPDSIVPWGLKTVASCYTPSSTHLKIRSMCGRCEPMGSDTVMHSPGQITYNRRCNKLKEALQRVFSCMYKELANEFPDQETWMPKAKNFLRQNMPRSLFKPGRLSKPEALRFMRLLGLPCGKTSRQSADTYTYPGW